MCCLKNRSERELFCFIGECSAIPSLRGSLPGVHSVASAGHFPSQTVAKWAGYAYYPIHQVVIFIARLM